MADGLLDFLKTAEGQGILSLAAGGLAGARRGQPINSLGRAGLAGLAGYGNALDRQTQEAQVAQAQEFRNMQMRQMQQQEQQKQLNQEVFSRLTSPQVSEPRVSMNEMGLPVVDQPSVQTPRKFDPMRAVQMGMSPDAVSSFQKIYESTQPKREVYKPGDVVFEGGKQVMSIPKEDSTPAAVKEYQFAVSQGYQGPFQQFELDKRRAGASNVDVKVNTKMGESVAGQIGPMAKDMRIQTQGAVKMFDAADRIEKALSSNAVMSGPLANQRMTVKQFVNTFAGGDDASVRNTRQVIKSLAQMAVEARKQLQGQGQVTENEAAAVAKADAGNIEDLTTGELSDLVTLTKRAANFQASAYQEMIGTMGAQPETKGMVPFYKVQGLEPLLKHNPQLPQIGGTKGYSDQAKEQRYQEWKRSQGTK